jgi:hypothetical protein
MGQIDRAFCKIEKALHGKLQIRTVNLQEKNIKEKTMAPDLALYSSRSLPTYMHFLIPKGNRTFL